MNLPKKPGKFSRGTDPARQHKTPAAPPVYKPESSTRVAQGKVLRAGNAVTATPLRQSSPLARTTIQPSKKQRDIRAAKIYSGQHGGMWYPSGSSGVSDKVSAELGMTAHELFAGPGSDKSKEGILAYWARYKYLTKAQLAARYNITVEELEKIIA